MWAFLFLLENMTLNQHKSIYLISLLLLSFNFIIPDNKIQATDLTINPDKQFSFAKSNFDSKDYQRALDEYNRFIFFFPDDDRTNRVLFNIAVAHFKLNQFQQSINTFYGVIGKAPNSNLSINAYFYISKNYVQLKKFGPAVLNLNELITKANSSHIKDKAYYNMGWINLDSILLSDDHIRDNEKTFQQAQNHFSKISDKNQSLFKRDQLLEVINQRKDLPYKSPTIAGVLSIIPGLGYIYNKRFKDALITFLICGTLAYTAYESFEEGHPALGGILGMTSLSFYSGSILGSINSAYKHNQQKKHSLIKELKKNTTVDVISMNTHQGIRVAWHWLF